MPITERERANAHALIACQDLLRGDTTRALEHARMAVELDDRLHADAIRPVRQA